MEIDAPLITIVDDVEDNSELSLNVNPVPVDRIVAESTMNCELAFDVTPNGNEISLVELIIKLLYPFKVKLLPLLKVIEDDSTIIDEAPLRLTAFETIKEAEDLRNICEAMEAVNTPETDNEPPVKEI